MSGKLFAVIEREFLQQIRTKAFWISTILIPTLGFGFILLQVALERNLTPRGRIAIVDLTGRVYEELVADRSAEGGSGRRSTQHIDFERVEATAESLAAVRTTLNGRVQDKGLKAYVVVDAGTLETGKAEWRGASVKADMVLRRGVRDLLSSAVTNVRMRDRGVDPKVYAAARLRAELDVREATDRKGEAGRDSGVNVAISGSMFLLIYVSLFIYGAYVMRGVIEEKSSRIVEVLVSSVRPSQLMLGKIIGIGAAGMVQYAIWGALALTVTAPGTVALLGVTDMPSVPLRTAVAFVVFFLLGYFLFASLYAALAAPFNTEQEAQQLIMIPILLLVMTSMTWFIAYDNPDGAFATALSFFPFTSPLIMFLRISVQPPPLWQIGLSVGLLVLAIWGMAWVAGRIYRVGILMYGKRPTLPEIFRWAAQSE